MAVDDNYGAYPNYPSTYRDMTYNRTGKRASKMTLSVALPDT